MSLSRAHLERLAADHVVLVAAQLHHAAEQGPQQGAFTAATATASAAIITGGGLAVAKVGAVGGDAAQILGVGEGKRGTM